MLATIQPPTHTFEAAPTLQPDEAERLAAELFGIRGQAHPLDGERDRNFHLRTGDGPGFVFKVHPPTEDPATVDFQIGALDHLAAVDPGLAVPRVVRTPDGTATAEVDLGGGRPQLARVLTWVPGAPLATASPQNAARLRGLGRILGRLDRALRGYFHPAGRAPLLWDVQRAHQGVPLLEYVEDDTLRALAREGLDRFVSRALPALRALRAQVIHNDGHTGNVLLDPSDPDVVSGVLDFGDLVHAPLIQELAVAAAYQLGPEDDLLGPIATLVAGYAEVVPLEAEELDLLVDLVLARRSLAVAIHAWASREEPAEMRPHVAIMSQRLRALLSFPRAEAAAQLGRAAGVRHA